VSEQEVDVKNFDVEDSNKNFLGYSR